MVIVEEQLCSHKKRTAKGEKLMKFSKKRRTLAEINQLYEDLWIAMGPRKISGRGAAERALARMVRAAERRVIRKIVDPFESGKAGAEASKRYQLYEEGQSVADFIGKHRDGGHLRLDVQRGCIRLEPITRCRAQRIFRKKSAR